MLSVVQRCSVSFHFQGVERHFADQSVGCEPDSVIQQGGRPTKLLEDGYFCLKLPGRENSPGSPGRRLRGSPHPSAAGPGPPLCPDTPRVTSLSRPEAARIPEGRGAGPVRTPVRSYECGAGPLLVNCDIAIVYAAYSSLLVQ